MDDKKTDNFSQDSQSRRRLGLISYLRHKNLKLSDEINVFIDSNLKKLENKQIESLRSLQKNIVSCGSSALIGENENKDVVFIGAHTCKSKICFIDNYLNQKRIRRKYISFFSDNEEITEMLEPDTGRTKYTTTSQIKKWELKGYEVYKKYQYDLMHLTLTVPHYKTGYKGNKYYFDDIKKLYWLIRKNKQFNSMVFGGEYGIEATHTENGWNIHIHSLLMVKRVRGSRNTLHKLVLKEWNKLTAGSGNRKELTKHHISEILKSNKTLTVKDVEILNPTGSTLIGLETIFSLMPGNNKVRSNTWNSFEMMQAVMEAISYHFKPQCFDEIDGKFKLDELAELLPVLKGKPLYGKFGALHGETTLNVNYKTPVESLNEDLEDSKEIIDTSNSNFDLDVCFMIIEPSLIFYDRYENKIIIGNRAREKAIVLGYIKPSMAICEFSGFIELKNKKYEQNYS